MSLAGELPRLDGAVFADTGWEPQAVYAHLDRLQTAAQAAGVPIHRVTAGNLRDGERALDLLRHTRWTASCSTPARPGWREPEGKRCQIQAERTPGGRVSAR
jgi:hypothetical protein